MEASGCTSKQGLDEVADRPGRSPELSEGA